MPQEGDNAMVEASREDPFVRAGQTGDITGLDVSNELIMSSPYVQHSHTTDLESFQIVLHQ